LGLRYFFRYVERHHLQHHHMFPTMNSVNEAYPHVDNKTKRLLTIDQVNKEFPVMMHKIWKATRERDGLFVESESTARSVNSNPDTTIRNVVLERSDASITLKCSQKPETVAAEIGSSTDNVQTSNTMASSVLSIKKDCETKTDDLLLSPSSQIVGVVEETCAICLEVPEDNHTVRSLKCGHCYHQICIDPWLTTQRGACPLCKRDYYLTPEKSFSERVNTLLLMANEDRSPQETRELNSRIETPIELDLLLLHLPSLALVGYIKMTHGTVRTPHFLLLCIRLDEIWE
jgi:hypothetical protein